MLKKALNKLMAIILIFMLTFTNFAFVTESYAASFFDVLLGNNPDSDTVTFKAYFEIENGEEIREVVSDVNNQELAIRMSLSVGNGVKLKDGIIEIKDVSDNPKLNFVLKDNIDLQGLAQIEGNVITLNQISDSEDTIELVIPVEYNNDMYFDETFLSKSFVVSFTGTYLDVVDETENIVTKDESLVLTWQDYREGTVTTSLEKYVDFGRGVIVQTKVFVDTTVEDRKTLPLEKTNINIRVPEYMGNLPSNIDVVANSTIGTNGKEDYKISAGDVLWNYNSEENIISIDTYNEVRSFEINKYENDLIQNAEENREVIDGYYNLPGIDEYLITYTYDNIQIESEPVIISSDIEANIFVLSSNYQEAFNKTETFEYELNEKIGNVLSLDEKSITENVSKAYFYANKNNEQYEIEIDSKATINIPYKAINENVVPGDQETGNEENTNSGDTDAEDTNIEDGNEESGENNQQKPIKVPYTKDVVKNIRIEDIDYKYIIDEQNIEISNQDVYYKRIAVNKENFNDILGNDGIITVYTATGEVIGYIGSENIIEIKKQEDESIFIEGETELIVDEADYILLINNTHEKLVIESSAPEQGGNLILDIKKGIKQINQDKATISIISSIKNDVLIKAKYYYVDDYVDVETASYEVKLKDTETAATLEMTPSNLKTLELNEDVSLVIKLNNNLETSDIYGYSEFDIDFPEYIENIEIKDATISNADGLQIRSYETAGNHMRIIIEGTQNGLNIGNLLGGTDIQIRADIKVNEFTPRVSRAVTLKTSNVEATNYVEDYTMSVDFEALRGVISATNYYNYNDRGETISSLTANGSNGELDIYSSEKRVRNEIVVMNNNLNVISNFKILGRIPFKDVEDIVTEDKLGTTIDTVMAGPIVSDENNDNNYKIYYSENEKATDRLDNENNGWVENPESFNNVKSFLIIPEDEEFLMNPAQIQRFYYEFIIPEGLTHNEYVYSTFITYYRDLSEVATINKTSTPDLVGLTTGIGPEFNVSVNSSRSVVKEYEEFQVDVVVSNCGESKAENINLTFPIPNGAIYERTMTEDEELQFEYNNDENKLIVNKTELENEEEIRFSVVLTVQKVVFWTTLEDGSVQSIIEPKLLISAKDLEKELEAVGQSVIVNKAEMEITLKNKNPSDVDIIRQLGDEVICYINVRNLRGEPIDDVVVNVNIPEGFKIKSTSLKNSSTGDGTYNTSYDENSNVFTAEIGRLVSGSPSRIELVLEIQNIDETQVKYEVYFNAKVTGNGVGEYNSKSLLTNIGRAYLEIEETSSNTNRYITEGEELEYLYVIRNKGAAYARNVKLVDVVPDGIIIRKLSYQYDGSNMVKTVGSNSDAVVTATIKPGSELEVKLFAVAANLGSAEEKEVRNYSTITSDSTKETNTDGIVHIIEQSERSKESKNSGGNSTNNNEGKNNSIESTYKVVGTAWLDENRDGARNSTEKLLYGVSVKLIDSQSGELIQTATTNSVGNYTFSGIKNGNYLAVFEFDTEKYTVTTFKKTGVVENLNSDVFLTDIVQGGKTKKAAVTETITIDGGSKSGIDAGLVLAKVFDLRLDKSITKVTVQTINGTETENFNNTKFTKTEIGAKYLAGSTVYVEYEIKVTNDGDIPGYAKKIVDYIPNGMTFNSTLGTNSEWYTGSDGNLYTDQLSNKQLAKNESATIKLVLTRQMTEDNTEIVSNIAEIFEDYNTQGYTDINSKAGNKVQSENDLSSADIAIMVKTGAVFINVSIIATTLLLLVIVAFMVYSQMLKIKAMKGGA